mmetsp:Transcript_3004/g.7013  ORF Transcript_3004/g.7013 Transcript_3004/m.7013 type:complete len:224 (+) Transcript_3004:23-694(+)
MGHRSDLGWSGPFRHSIRGYDYENGAVRPSGVPCPGDDCSAHRPASWGSKRRLQLFSRRSQICGSCWGQRKSSHLCSCRRTAELHVDSPCSGSGEPAWSRDGICYCRGADYGCGLPCRGEGFSSCGGDSKWFPALMALPLHFRRAIYWRFCALQRQSRLCFHLRRYDCGTQRLLRWQQRTGASLAMHSGRRCRWNCAGLQCCCRYRPWLARAAESAVARSGRE